MTTHNLRMTSAAEGDVVVFLIGMRVNRWWKPWQWLRTALAMPRMLRELAAHPELGLLSSEAWFGRTTIMLGMVIAFSSLAHRLSAAVAGALFFGYAVLNGVTLSILFLAYTASSIGSTFFVTAGTFGAISAYGYATKRDLSGLGSFAMMGLIGLVIASVVNIFLHSTMIYWLTTFVGVIVFTGLTAYDTQKLKRFAGAVSPGDQSKVALQGALMLYLDFINLFLMLLRLFGDRRR